MISDCRLPILDLSRYTLWAHLVGQLTTATLRVQILKREDKLNVRHGGQALADV